MSTFDNAVRVLFDCFPRFDLTVEQVETWRAVLADCAPDALSAAAVQLARESDYPPTIASWRARALTISGGGPAWTMSAAEAWDEMRRHRVKRAQTRLDSTPYMPKWTSEAVRRASEAVGWDDPSWETEQLPTIRAQFERYYNAIKGKQEQIDGSQEATALLPNVMRSIGRGEGPRRLMDSTGGA